MKEADSGSATRAQSSRSVAFAHPCAARTADGRSARARVFWLRPTAYSLQPIVAVACFAAATPTWGFEWNKDMVDQPSVKPQESSAPPPPDSMPIAGRETLPTPETERESFKAKDEAVSLRNPVPATAESIARGAYLYQINCVVCHGEQGHGDGPVGKKLDPSPVDLNKDYTQQQADGQLFFTLTRGRVAMPFYRDALSREERWDVINYVRSEFGKNKNR